MKLTFLGADRPLTKQYSLTPAGQLNKISAPMVYNVTSYEVEAYTLEEMHGYIQAAAENGWCLLKGNTNRPLVNESRAGSTDPKAETEWLCIDSDGSPYATADELMDALGMPDVSYVLQWSSSHGIETRSGLRCHLFVRCSRPMSVELAKRWLYTMNLTTATLWSTIRLTASSVSLTYPLDISTCQNDKLIYIAPPQLGPGLSDPVTERIQLVKKKYDEIDVERIENTSWNDQRISEEKDKLIRELRTKAGLDNRAARTTLVNGIEIAKAPTAANTWESRQARGFTYFNLNGGDSWGYYHPDDDPTFIHNFKGEPVYRTQDVLPEYWRQLQSLAKRAKPDTSGTTILGFVERASGQHYVAERSGGVLQVSPCTSEKQLRDRLLSRGRVAPALIPDWEVVWDPTSSQVFDAEKKVLNTFQASEVMGREAPGSWDTIRGLMLHVVGGSEEALDNHLNWLAHVYQTRQRAGTAWVFHGTQGTGKGLLYSEVLTPVFGADNVSKITTDHVDAGWTDQIEKKLIVVVDEMDIESSKQAETAMAQLKLFITEPTLSSRRKFRDSRTVSNHASLMFFSNMQHSVSLGEGDRRFNVAPRQENPLPLPSKQMIEALRSELAAFAHFLLNYQIDASRVIRPLQNQARTTLAELSLTAAKRLANILKAGNLAELASYLTTVPDHQLITREGMAIQASNDLLKELILTGRRTLTREELGTLFQGLVGNVPTAPHKLSQYLNHQGISVKPCRLGDKIIRGAQFEWVQDPELEELRSELEAGGAKHLEVKRVAKV